MSTTSVNFGVVRNGGENLFFIRVTMNDGDIILNIGLRPKIVAEVLDEGSEASKATRGSVAAYLPMLGFTADKMAEFTPVLFEAMNDFVHAHGAHLKAVEEPKEPAIGAEGYSKNVEAHVAFAKGAVEIWEKTPSHENLMGLVVADLQVIAAAIMALRERGQDLSRIVEALGRLKDEASK